MSAPRVELVAAALGFPVSHLRDLLAYLVDGEPMTLDLAESLDSIRAAVNGYSRLADLAIALGEFTTFDTEADGRVLALMSGA